MTVRTTIVGVLALLVLAAPASADPCRKMWEDGRAIHADLQRKAIDELGRKDYDAACKTMRDLTRISNAMREYAEQRCRANEPAKRRLAAADNIAARTREICAQAGQ